MFQKEFSAVCYGESRVTFEDGTAEHDRDTFVRATLFAMIEQNVMGTKTQQVHARFKIHRSVLQTDFKYMAIVWSNEQDLMDYHEKEEFEPFDNVELLNPEKGNTFNVKVEPYQRRMVVFRQQQEGSVMRGKPKIKIKTNQEAILQKCIQEGKVIKKGLDNIYCKFLKYAEGVIFVYLNDSDDTILHELVEFELKGIVICGQEDQRVVQFQLGPKQQKVVLLRITQEDSSMKMKEAKSELEKVEETKYE